LLVYLLSTPVELVSNARHELLLEAGAERTLEAVSSMPLLCGIFVSMSLQPTFICRTNLETTAP
jgi:hypothetical protein